MVLRKIRYFVKFFSFYLVIFNSIDSIWFFFSFWRFLVLFFFEKEGKYSVFVLFILELGEKYLLDIVIVRLGFGGKERYLVSNLGVLVGV